MTTAVEYNVSLSRDFLHTGTVPRQVASPNAHTLAADDVVSCCLDLSVPSISFRINGHPVQGMFENFNVDGLFFPVISFSAGVKSVQHDNKIPSLVHMYLCVQIMDIRCVFVSGTSGLASSLVVAMESSSSCPRRATLRATRLCCQERGCASSLSKSTNTTLRECATFWVPPCP